MMENMIFVTSSKRFVSYLKYGRRSFGRVNKDNLVNLSLSFIEETIYAIESKLGPSMLIVRDPKLVNYLLKQERINLNVYG